MSHSVSFKKVTKKYKMYNKTSEKLLDILIPDGFGEDFYALQNINFTAEKGDVIGIIGVNGAGKSTLSNLITGVIPPTLGEIEVKGQASLIAIASGLNNQLTGRENIELKCLMLGFSKKEIKELMPEIIDFADIGKFIDQPVKSYSSGMKSRLGFAISVNINPDVLVIDEALSVGDQTFTDKCLDKMNEFKQNGKTIFFISHSIGQVKKFCQKALWLEAGEVRAYGSIEEIVPQYEKFLKEFKAMSKKDQKNFKQLVLEKRSKLREQEKGEEEKIPRGHSRSGRKKSGTLVRYMRRAVMAILVFAVLLGGAGYMAKSGVLSYFDNKSAGSETVNTVENKEAAGKQGIASSQTEVKPDIRYVKFSSVNIRELPDINSNAIGIANFGQFFEIKDLQADNRGTEWLKVNDLNGNQGWISSGTMSAVNNPKNDEELANAIDQLIGFYPSLNDAIPMIGKRQGNEEAFSYTEYMYINELVHQFTINVSSSSETEVIKRLGEPDIKDQNMFLYHGNEYDFIFTVLENGAIESLSVSRNQLET
ncbi:teichoic acids export ABC transporter ATP-binding subunit TagH [Cytobacillus firmus]|uniref:teichoic acids export ABC transporter ATP-binding subunit TagH n=1 Tax=Cytobacillus firmus TaxID=1399 RepID=UPI00203F4522|nr:teichoic acids export ABC transporter ATP-binding subunit TagH [Cytobacillus firmus]MCM3705707.1 teichoic acids export ABC transporter ATP-binding subunit TagH [Cytobacillus firmus]